MPTTGPMSRAGVSSAGGRNESNGIEPQEEVIRPRHGLNDRRIRLARRTEGTKKDGAGGNREQNDSRKNDVLPDRVRNEGHASCGQCVVFPQVGRAPHDAARHRPFVDSQLQHHQHVQAHEPDQQSRE